MRTTKDDLRAWFDEGVAQGATHMVVACDTFSYEDYPIFVAPAEDVRKVVADEGAKQMTRIMEVYDLRMDKELQMREERSFHVGDA